MIEAQPTDDALARLLAAKRGARIDMVMRRHRSTFAAAWTEFDDARPDWHARWLEVVNAGLVNAKGNAPTLRCVQRGWYRLERANKAKAAASQKREARRVVDKPVVEVLAQPPAADPVAPGQTDPITEVMQRLNRLGNRLPGIVE